MRTAVQEWGKYKSKRMPSQWWKREKNEEFCKLEQKKKKLQWRMTWKENQKVGSNETLL